MDKSDIKVLFERYKSGQCTAEEIQLLHDWLDSGDFESKELTQEEILVDIQQLETHLPLKRTTTIRKLYRRIGNYAAAAALLLGLGYTYYQYTRHNNTEDLPVVQSPLEPGRNVAILHLEDGSPIVLDSIEQNKVLDLDGALVQLNSEGQLVYLSDHKSKQSKTNQLITPKGGQYELMLSDGTKVWLNSDSKLSFSTNFENQSERFVSLEGEAYFEVSPNKDKPFIVSVQGQSIRVLGTAFNVNAYSENNYIKASLLEGSVLFNKSKLQPGQSALYTSHKTKIYEENMDDVLDWKNGYFVFFEETLAEAMKKIARWYDLEVSYADEATQNILVGGSISKYENASKVFEMIEKAGDVHISIAGKKVHINKVQPTKNTKLWKSKRKDKRIGDVGTTPKTEYLM